jgi:hypothetical protein
MRLFGDKKEVLVVLVLVGCLAIPLYFSLYSGTFPYFPAVLLYQTSSTWKYSCAKRLAHGQNKRYAGSKLLAHGRKLSLKCIDPSPANVHIHTCIYKYAFSNLEISTTLYLDTTTVAPKYDREVRIANINR